ncbi:hypothetical protein EKO04_006199 [Ascochyta lentis]|uniref:Uncharacterized protein n=1 Tax=Ascochyta lentis TaxID=205686 RepID=A0A8H7J5U9_9PLEO|nr:hypothetical protein EKO04_006199 [Ascochyta lentis]
MIQLPIKYPWPVGTFTHTSFLASFICNAPADALFVFLPTTPASQRQQLKDYRTAEMDRIVAILIHTMYRAGIQFIDLKNIMSYALILLLRFRNCRPDQCPAGGGDTILWTTVAVRIACVSISEADARG